MQVHYGSPELVSRSQWTTSGGTGGLKWQCSPTCHLSILQYFTSDQTQNSLFQKVLSDRNDISPSLFPDTVKTQYHHEGQFIHKVNEMCNCSLSPPPDPLAVARKIDGNKKKGERKEGRKKKGRKGRKAAHRSLKNGRRRWWWWWWWLSNQSYYVRTLLYPETLTLVTT